MKNYTMVKKVILILVLIFIIFLSSIFVYSVVTVVDQTGNILCESDVGNVKSVKARIQGGAECNKYGGWSKQGEIYKIGYQCTVPSGTSKNVECYVDPSISYTTTQTKSASVTNCNVNSQCWWGVENCEGKFDSNCNCIDTADSCPVACSLGKYKRESDGACMKCGGVKICGTTYYCGVNDGVCPNTYSRNINGDSICNYGGSECASVNDPNC